MTGAAAELESLESPALQQICLELNAPLMRVTDPVLAKVLVRQSLERLYPGLVRPHALVRHYVMVWCEDIKDFKIVCCEDAEFTIRCRDGDVTVEVLETAVYY